MPSQIRTLDYNGTKIEYTLTIKKVKNINLRVKCTGQVIVSAPTRVQVDRIDEFVLSKAEFILKAIDEFKSKTPVTQTENQPQNQPISKYDCYNMFMELVKKIYPMFEPYGVEMPTIKIRKMKSRWGSCIPSSKIITLNTHLAPLSKELIEYVIIHEFCHFIHPNHSKNFYAFMEKFCPDWKERKKEMSKVVIR